LTESIGRTLDGVAVERLLDTADLGKAAEAVYFARHFYLFFGDGQQPTDRLEQLLSHIDWRVRAALAQGLNDLPADSQTAGAIVDRLVRDRDYKVRAAAARAIGTGPARLAGQHADRLLADENWHVRECCLQGTLASLNDASRANHLVDRILATIAADDSWDRCPAGVANLVQRILLLRGVPDQPIGDTARHDALFLLLRELRTGWITPGLHMRHALVQEASDSPNWLVVREAASLGRDGSADNDGRPDPPIRSPQEQFRRLRNRRAIQVALDITDLDRAVDVARAAAEAGVDLIEVGDPLIKRHGLAAVTHIKRHAPHTTVVAEMMSADWGREQVEVATAAGADVVLLIGPATTASVSAAVMAGRRIGVPIMLDVPAGHSDEHWIRAMERLGVDGFTITTNIDLGVGGCQPLEQARVVRGWTRLPVAVSGGFSATDHAVIGSADWDILIVGRSLTDAVQPARACRLLLGLIDDRGKGAP
jgi:3-keto-L-gulonate-6-phosphate decarboxylase